MIRFFKNKYMAMTAVLAMVLIVSLSGCGLFGAKKEAGGDEKESPAPAEITQEDAEAIISDKLYETDARGTFQEMKSIDGENYYIFEVADSEGEEHWENLAVNSVSGEVFVYDGETGEVEDYSEFSLYDEAKDEKISWEGTFRNGTYEVTLDPADENAFEINIKKEGKSELVGVVQVDDTGKTGKYDDGKVSLSFERDGDTLIISDEGGSSGYAGTYSQE